MPRHEQRITEAEAVALGEESASRGLSAAGLVRLALFRLTKRREFDGERAPGPPKGSPSPNPSGRGTRRSEP